MLWRFRPYTIILTNDITSNSANFFWLSSLMKFIKVLFKLGVVLALLFYKCRPGPDQSETKSLKCFTTFFSSSNSPDLPDLMAFNLC